MKKIIAILLLLTMVIGAVPVYAAKEKAVVLEEMMTYAMENLEIALKDTPKSPAQDFDLFTWEKVSIQQRDATVSEIEDARAQILSQLRLGIQKYGVEVLSEGMEDFKSQVSNGFTLYWWDPSSEIGDFVFKGKYNMEQLDQLFTSVQQSLSSSIQTPELASKNDYIEDLLMHTEDVFDALLPSEQQLKVMTETEIEAHKIEVISDLEAVLESYDMALLKENHTQIKQVIDKESKFDPSDYRLDWVASGVNHFLNNALREKQQLAYENSWEKGMVSPWAKEFVEDAISKGYVPSHLQSNYQQPITREEFAELFVTALFADFNKEISGYSNSTKSSWQFETLTIESFLSKVSSTDLFLDTDKKYVKVANILGIINGVGNQLFNPNGLITREQAAVMFANYYQTILSPSGGNAAFELEDFDLASSWSKPGIEWTYSAGLIGGTRAFIAESVSGQKEPKITQIGYFDSKGHLTREQAILILNNAQESNSLHGILALRGYVPVSIFTLMSGFDIDGNKVMMKESDYHHFKYSADKYMGHKYYKTKTSYILEYSSEKLDSIYLMPLPLLSNVAHSMYNVDNIDRVVNGEQTNFDYGLVSIEHNKDGYLVILDKKDSGYFWGRGWMKDGQFEELTVFNDSIDEYDPLDVEARNYAEQMIEKLNIDDKMDQEKINIIMETLKKHGYYWETALSYHIASGTNNYHSAYNALVERFSNYSGWYNAYKMMFEMAGLETNPEKGTEADKYDFAKDGRLTGKIAVKAEGEWIYIDFLPLVYTEPLSAEASNQLKENEFVESYLSYLDHIRKSLEDDPDSRTFLSSLIEDEISRFHKFDIDYPETESMKDYWRDKGLIFVNKNASAVGDKGIVFLKDAFESDIN